MNTEIDGLLRFNEQLYHINNALADLIDECPYQAHLADAQTGRYLYCNLEFSEYIGISIKDFKGLTVETCFNQRQWEEKTDLFCWWREKEPENLRKFNEEVQKTQQRIKKQRLSITSTGLIRFKETVKAPVFSRYLDQVIVILTQSQDITLHCNLLHLLNTYKHYYADQKAVQKMLITLDIDGFFVEQGWPTIEEMEILLHCVTDFLIKTLTIIPDLFKNA